MSSAPQFQNADLSRDAPLPRIDSRSELVDSLRRQLGCLETANTADEASVFSCGVPALDRLLPGGGLRHGMLVEWIGAKSSRAEEQQNGRAEGRQQLLYRSAALPLYCSSIMTLGLLAAREACREGGVLVVIDRRQTFYPPAAAAWGIDLERLIVVRPQNARDELWAAVQSLRSPVVAAMWAHIDRLDSRAFRRLQLAAQAGRTLGVLLRPASVRGQPSWADVTLEVRKLQNANCTTTLRAVPEIENWGTSSTINNLQFAICNLQSPTFRQVQVRVSRCHAGRPSGFITLEVDDTTYTIREADSIHATHPLPVVPKLADPAGHSRSARA
jgi:hypothetical protein